MKFGEQNSNWRHENIGYRAAHMRVLSVKGHATEHQCVCCGENAHEWAYDGVDPRELTTPRGLAYSPRVDHYEAMCRPCHRFNDWVYRAVANGTHPAVKACPDFAQVQTRGVGA